MTPDRFSGEIIHMSYPDKDTENDAKRGTPDHDHLFRLMPLLNSIKESSNTYFHPGEAWIPGKWLSSVC